MSLTLAASGGSAYWYLTRSTGAVALLLLTFAIALGFTLVGAAIFSVTGKRASQIPQEAVIGISYVVAAAAAVLLLSRAAEGDEEIKNMLVGNILLVTPLEVWKCFGLFVAVGLFHFFLRKNFLLVSFDRDGAYPGGRADRHRNFRPAPAADVAGL